jgi:hypothetical protein
LTERLGFDYDGGVNRPAWIPSRVVASALVLLYTAIGLLLFGYRYLEDLASRRMGTLVPRFIDEMTGVYTALAAIPSFFGRRAATRLRGRPGKPQSPLPSPARVPTRHSIPR